MNKQYFLYLFLGLLTLTGVAQRQPASMVAGVDRTQKLSKPGSPQAVCDTIFSFQTVDAWPSDIVYDGTILYSNGNDNGFIYKYAPTGQLLDSIPNPTTNSFKGGGMDFDGTNLWAVVEEDSKVYKIDRNTGVALTQYPLPGALQNYWGCAYDNGFIWTSDYTAKNLCKINAGTGATISNIICGRMLFAIKVINGDLWAVEWRNGSSNSAQLVKLDRNTGAGLDSIPWCLGYPLGMCFAQNHIWGVSSMKFSGTQRIYEFDTTFATLRTSDISVQFNLFPNPCSQRTNVYLDGHYDNGSIALLDVLGRPVQKQTFSGDRVVLDLSSYTSGVYFVRLLINGKVVTRKLMIE